MTEHYFDDRDAASLAAAEFITLHLERRLSVQPRASLIVTGGSSPAACYSALSETDLDWERTDIVLSDERWIPPESMDSNEKLVRETLLTGHADAAQLTPMYSSEMSIEEQCEHLDRQLRKVPIPFSAALLGMGEDGHFASLFPDADNLEQGLDTDAATLCLAVSTAASPHPRISLTLAAIARSDVIVVLMFGDKKRAVYEAAKEKDGQYPVAALLRQKLAPVHIFWAP